MPLKKGHKQHFRHVFFTKLSESAIGSTQKSNLIDLKISRQNFGLFYQNPNTPGSTSRLYTVKTSNPYYVKNFLCLSNHDLNAFKEGS